MRGLMRGALQRGRRRSDDRELFGKLPALMHLRRDVHPPTNLPPT